MIIRCNTWFSFVIDRKIDFSKLTLISFQHLLQLSLVFQRLSNANRINHLLQHNRTSTSSHCWSYVIYYIVFSYIFHLFFSQKVIIHFQTFIIILIFVHKSYIIVSERISLDPNIHVHFHLLFQFCVLNNCRCHFQPGRRNIRIELTIKGILVFSHFYSLHRKRQIIFLFNRHQIIFWHR